MNDAVDPKAEPEELVDGVKIAETETGDRYRIHVGDDGLLSLSHITFDGADPEQVTPAELDHDLKYGTYYVPEYSPAGDVHEAVEMLAGQDNSVTPGGVVDD
ncbi:hypothetical protein [Halorussus marinus]|uniref:hypothetical protein n=1 Tax=Halorussus marinus TaxID=2505976 RepID=UPI00106EA062|nr:hypothetical protein [Halorussus marinus]